MVIGVAICQDRKLMDRDYEAGSVCCRVRLKLKCLGYEIFFQNG
jgi:hypothetical protein